MTSTTNITYHEENILKPQKGIPFLVFSTLLFFAACFGIVWAAIQFEAAAKLDETAGGLPIAVMIVCGLYAGLIYWFIVPGFKQINPNEAGVYILFGQYHGTIKTAGFWWINPFCTTFNPVATSDTVKLINAATSKEANLPGGGDAKGKKVSLRRNTLNNNHQLINDKEGNPIQIGAIVIWRVENPTKAVFEVDHYKEFINTQCDAALRNIAQAYPYDAPEGTPSLRGSTHELAEKLQKELESRVEIAGLVVEDARISHLAYAPEIAAAMLQRQQADALIAAREKIVTGAVSIVKTALQQLSDEKIVALDEERKAQMVSNLLVVLCGNKDPQPILNSGSIY